MAVVATRSVSGQRSVHDTDSGLPIATAVVPM